MEVQEKGLMSFKQKGQARTSDVQDYEPIRGLEVEMWPARTLLWVARRFLSASLSST